LGVCGLTILAGERASELGDHLEDEVLASELRATTPFADLPPSR